MDKDKKVSADKKEADKVEAQERIRIKLRSYDHRMLDQSVVRIMDAAKRTGAIIGRLPCKS